MRVHVVTDSSAHFVHAQVPAQYPLTVVPNRLTIGGQQYLEGNDLTAERALELIAHQPTPPQVVPPTMDDFASVYTRLAYHNDAIISIHASRRLSDSWQHAHEAAAQVAGYIKVYVIDSMTLDAAQGLLVRAALRAVEDLDDDPVTLEAAVEQVRGAAERAYAVYYPETPDYLMRNQLLTPSHAILNRIQGTMPLLSVENGELSLWRKSAPVGKGWIVSWSLQPSSKHLRTRLSYSRAPTPTNKPTACRSNFRTPSQTNTSPIPFTGPRWRLSSARMRPDWPYWRNRNL